MTIAFGRLDQTLVSEQNLFQAESDLAVAEGNVALGLVAIYRALWWQMADTGRQFLCDCRNERANAGAIKLERPIA